MRLHAGRPVEADGEQHVVQPRDPAIELIAARQKIAQLGGQQFDALGRAASTTGKDLAKAIAETKEFRGVTGVITIDAERNAKKPAVILKVEGGKTRYVATIEPQK